MRLKVYTIETKYNIYYEAKVGDHYYNISVWTGRDAIDRWCELVEKKENLPAGTIRAEIDKLNGKVEALVEGEASES